jgi:hypothetical protein
VNTALRAGLARASHELAGNGLAGSVLAFTLGRVFAPSVEWFARQVQ